MPKRKIETEFRNLSNIIIRVRWTWTRTKWTPESMSTPRSWTWHGHELFGKTWRGHGHGHQEICETWRGHGHGHQEICEAWRGHGHGHGVKPVST